MKKTYTKKQINIALKNLKEKLPDNDVQNGTLFQVSHGINISSDFTRKSLKRIHATDCNFDKSIFKAAAGVGSKFSNVRFIKCDFSGSNFQYCYFANTYFADGTFAKGANFSHSIFIKCSFIGIKVKECTFFDCQFQNCTFSKSAIKSITLENSVFNHCIIKNIDLGHLNLEYTKFSEISMSNVTLPPYQVAYIIGAPTYLLTTNDKIYIYTSRGKITVKQYNNYLDDLAKYYYSQKEFFPIANIMIAFTKYDEAFDYIQRGIREAFDYSDFRMVKHFCRLAISCSSFSHLQLKFLYELITDLSYKIELNTYELHSYFINIGEIRELLLNGAENKERVEFVIKTNIDKDDLTCINELYNKINCILNMHCSDEHIDSIELRHNSPYELLVTCIDTMPSIITLIPAIYGLLVVGGKALDVYQKFGEAQKIHQQNSLYKYDKRIKELEIIEKEQKIASYNNEAQYNKSGILTISEIEHNIKCSTLNLAGNLAPEYLHYKYVKDISK